MPPLPMPDVEGLVVEGVVVGVALLAGTEVSGEAEGLVEDGGLELRGDIITETFKKCKNIS